MVNSQTCVYKYKNHIDGTEFIAQLKGVIREIKSNEEGYLSYNFMYENNPYVAVLELENGELTVITKRQAKHIRFKDDDFYLHNFDLQNLDNIPNKNKILINGKCVHDNTLLE